MGELLVLGLNHRIAPVEVRERLAFGPERLPAALAALQAELAADLDGGRVDSLPEVVILSTCNRTEVYVWVAADVRPSGDVEPLIRRHLAERGRLEPQAAAEYLTARRGDEAACHLLRVAAGLDSLVVGENEILGQVKVAYEAARGAGTAGPTLSALFRYAIQAGKRVRGETEIGRAALSTASIVVELAQEVFGALADRTALLIGAGKMSSIAGHALVRAGLHCVLVANRTFDRAERLAVRLGGRAVHFDALTENLTAADIVICSTGAPHLVLHADDVRRGLAARAPVIGASEAAPDARGPGCLLVVDLAVPRDADPAIAMIPGVRLVDIDDLEMLVQANHPLAAAVLEAADAVVREELESFRSWLDGRCCAPVIQALRERADAICRAEVEKALRRLGELSPQQQAAVAAMARAIANKLLHDPIVNLKAPPEGGAAGEYVDLAARLFGLSG